MQLKYKDYPETKESIEMIREMGVEYWLIQMEKIKQHNHAVIDNRFRLWGYLWLTLFIGSIIANILIYEGK